MSFLAFSGLINFIFSLFIGIVIFQRNPSDVRNRSYFYTALSVALYSFGYFFWQISISSAQAALWFKILTTGIILINVTFVHFVFAFVDVAQRNQRKIFFLYLTGLIFIFLNISSLLFGNLEPRHNLGFWPTPTLFFNAYLIVWFGQCFYGFSWLLRGIKTSAGSQREQRKYLTLGAVVGFIGGATNWPMWYGINFPPYFNILISVYIAIVAYAIIKYHLMGIRLAVTKVGIFFVVFALTLGIPFWVGYQTRSWLLSTSLAILLAICGPVIHRRFQRKAEEALQKEQFTMRRALREFAETLPHLKDTAKLVNELCEGAYEIIQPKFCGVYLFDYDKDAYVLKQFLSEDEHPLPDKIAKDSALVIAAALQSESLALDKVPNIIGFGKESYLLPFFRDEMLNGFLLLGPKETSDVYDASDVDIFEILRAQCVLAFENCLFWQDEKIRLSREEQIKRHQTMDHFSSSMAHEIDNPATGIRGVVSLIRDNIAEKYKDKFSPEDYAEMVDWMDTVVHNAKRISDLVAAVRAFSKQDTGEFHHLSLDAVLNSLLLIMGPQFKHNDVYFSTEIEKDIVVYGNQIYLEEALVNLMENSLHAVRDNVGKGRKKEIAFKVYRLTGGDLFRMEISDNGYGITKDPGFIENIFVDYVTTKASTEGSGMGLSRVRKVIQMHKGKIWAESEGKETGARFIVELPSYHGPADPVKTSR